MVFLISFAAVILLLLLGFYLTKNKWMEGFNSTDSYWMSIKENERHLDPHLYLSRCTLNRDIDFKAKAVNLNDPDFPRDKALVKYDKDLIDKNMSNITDKLKPDFLTHSGSNLIEKYDKQYYYDKRYMESAISVDFAKNPGEFCNLHPEDYPCRKIPLSH